ncbi:MAG: bifunctional DNA-formamidopyrimidine glycosylase/DNA-(apurinic or apyrimidinic site) lyase [Gemmatimonadetes bacterium]|nr:bifunctional DNA-formamidopyrimidine glycosylase/DNA-(apurinic or apyrimidinic site) lyase [Gemmatimonadota bacterium]
MPELPETETIARDLDAALRGAVIEAVSIVRDDVLREASAAMFVRAVRGARITRVSRRAKSIVLRLERGVSQGSTDRVPDLHHLVVTPRFTGALLLTEPTDERYTCLRLTLADGRTLRYHDIRRLGTIALHDAARHTAWDATLGPEPLDPALDADAIWNAMRSSRQAIKTLLMDQRKLAGVGNIYANEALWRARIRPTRAGKSLRRLEASALLESLRAVLTESIALRGTTFRDFQDAYGSRGGFAAKLAVYGRAGLPCNACGTPFRTTHRLAGRQTVWCPTCQR